MLCCNCKKNQAAKTYERVKDGEKFTQYYCLDCYQRLFLDVVKTEDSLSVCPYCGMTKEELSKGKLVGCGYCYKTLFDMVMPLVISMQGVETHKGKCPPLEDEEEQSSYTDAECETEKRKRARFLRQCHELETIIGKLVAEQDFQGAKEYEEKLKRMKEKSEVEEEFVWRRRSLFKTLSKKT